MYLCVMELIGHFFGYHAIFSLGVLSPLELLPRHFPDLLFPSSSCSFFYLTLVLPVYLFLYNPSNPIPIPTLSIAS